MPTLEDFQNMVEGVQQVKVERSPLYQHAIKEAALQQQHQEIPPEVQAVFDELKGTQERNAVRTNLQRYNDAVQYRNGGYVNKFDGTGKSAIHPYGPMYHYMPEYYMDFGIGNHPDFDEDFRNRYGLRYAPYNEIDFGETAPDNIRVQNQGNVTATAFQWDNPSGKLLVGPDNKIINKERLAELSRQYRAENADAVNKRYSILNGEKPAQPVAPEFWLLTGAAPKAASTLNSVISPLFNMTAVDNVISDVSPYSGYGNMMSQNFGGPEWAWDLAHPAFAKDIWNLGKAAGKGIYNWMERHTPESAYNMGITAPGTRPFESFDRDAFERAGGYVLRDDEPIAGTISDNILDITEEGSDAANAVARSAREAVGATEPIDEREVQLLMQQYGFHRDEAERTLALDREFRNAIGGSQPIVQDLGTPLVDDASYGTQRRVFPRVEDVEDYMASNPNMDFDTAQEELFGFNDPSIFTQENRDDLIEDFLDTYGVSRARAEQEVDRILEGTHPEFHVDGIVPTDPGNVPTYEEIMKNPKLLKPYEKRLRGVHPNLPAGTSPEQVSQMVRKAMDDFESRPPLSTYEQLGYNFSANSAPAILGNIQGIQAKLIREGKFPGIMKVEPAGVGYGRNTLNEYGRVNWGTAEEPFNPYLDKIGDDLFEMPYGRQRVSSADIAGWPTPEQAADKINRRLQRIYNQYAPYSQEVRDFGADNFKVTVDRNLHTFVAPRISWVFNNGGPINYFAGGGKTNSEQLWNKAKPLYNELTTAGVPHMAAVGVLGNIALESGVNPNASNKVNGGHWGYTQNDKAITNHIKKYYGGYGHKEQMQFLKDGLTGQIRGAKQAPWLQKRFDEYKHAVNGVNDPAKAALMWEKYYEKSSNEALDKRTDYAKYFHSALGSPDYQYSPERYNSSAMLGPLMSETTEAGTQEQVPWYNKYQLNDDDYAALYNQGMQQLPWMDQAFSLNPIQQSSTYPNLFAGGGDTRYVKDTVDAIKKTFNEKVGSTPSYDDLTYSDEWADAHGYYPDARGHRDDRVKKPAHPTYPGRGQFVGNEFHFTNDGLNDVNRTLWGLIDNGDGKTVPVYNNTFVLPELTVTPNGSYIQNTYDNIKYFAGGGYIEDGLRSLGVNGFRVTSGYRGPNSKVGRAGKRSGHARTLKDGSSGAIDIVPTDKSPSGWARLEQQLRSPDVQQFLASFGGTVLDERDATTMKKTGATGQHFHIGLGVKGGGNFYNKPAERNYAQRSPVSVFSPVQSSTVQEGQYTPWYSRGSGMTDEDWAALYRQGESIPFAFPYIDLGISAEQNSKRSGFFPNLFG